MDSKLIGTIAGVGGAILVAIITLIGTIISSNKSISKKNSDQHSTQNIEHTKILEKQESYVKTIDSTRTKVEKY
ncbi:hypothetical protein [Spiroplasma endosymbiont of Stenodema calcarata]|uniref:hypothetical protein n=1 Tax=Spiroplasma endosymbiont of Stenodema calcarata TaxID=3139328 RepID=UPI003CCAF7DC